MRIIFAGTPDFAASHLLALLEAKHDIVAVYTQPDRPAGRGKKLQASAVKQLALTHGLPVFQPPSLKAEDAQQALISIQADLMIVVAYGLILPKIVLQAPQLGCINVHGSILPKWRGAAPIQRSLWAGDKETGVTIMQMDEGLDTGDILLIEKMQITLQDTSASLYAKLAELGPKALLKSLKGFKQLKPTKQDNNEASYAAKLSKHEAHLDWQLSALQLALNVRAFNPWPVAWFTYNEKPIKVWQAKAEALVTSDHTQTTPGQILYFDKTGLGIATNDGVLVITQLQLAGKKTQEVEQLVNGNKHLFEVGQELA